MKVCQVGQHSYSDTFRRLILCFASDIKSVKIFRRCKHSAVQRLQLRLSQGGGGNMQRLQGVEGAITGLVGAT